MKFVPELFDIAFNTMHLFVSTVPLHMFTILQWYLNAGDLNIKCKNCSMQR